LAGPRNTELLRQHNAQVVVCAFTLTPCSTHLFIVFAYVRLRAPHVWFRTSRNDLPSVALLITFAELAVMPAELTSAVLPSCHSVIYL
jgi:hypothetical protein